MLKIQNLTKCFWGNEVLKSCSFEVPKNSIVALVGSNGSGKSTILNLISGIIKPNSGSIFLEDKKISGLSVESISNAGVSRLFQDSQLFTNLTVKENLILALENNAQSFWSGMFVKTSKCLVRELIVSNTLDLIEMPGVANEKAGNLSYGQQRLLQIAMAILNPHKLLLLDEPMAWLSVKLRSVVFKLLKELKKQGVTILFVEHDMEFVASLADSLIILDAGEVIANGCVDELKKSNWRV